MDQYNSYKITVVQFDTRVYGVDTFTSDDGRTTYQYELVGGGGTEFEVVTQYMEQEDTFRRW